MSNEHFFCASPICLLRSPLPSPRNKYVKICLVVSIVLLNFSLMPQTADSDESNLGEGAASGGATSGHQAEERGDKRLWRSVVIGEQEHRIDMKCIEPYKRVISHGGTQTEMLKSVLHSGPLSL